MVMPPCNIGWCALLIHTVDVLAYILMGLEPASHMGAHFK